MSASAVFPSHTSYLWEREEKALGRDHLWYRHPPRFQVAGGVLGEVKEVCCALKQTSSYCQLQKWVVAVQCFLWGEGKEQT